ncbi:MAG: hypothetical protein UV61_C0005G0034 [Candidatus Gottesmanbacteria bacterium GW2011_GWB1_43_11]|uniref:Uncharacterized protein n=1 Tax=Candidatus Gottesmanbacteria bacterium GW2011_GWB1_43_11 TaxID=1618446 RepID=A0A0G1FJH2_9BACT|nr:MAG: hypothetical protein UV04_C0010G0034 [Candidatus Gottesmanbacteria bacterium GW2011_GWA2_42_16]KKS81736.1 MAG: hypothetical protein UV55_C0009G0012 [Candidatus Gottesmanbacteria bacterium GW2011_GWC1_43_10]KKS87013.1 MAG: hypothetical protein UV61_C0005G0034 [Candidatus Gottesmanbacteria bacterium GW2011_GWB1_43_11]OGG07543.1 MAG: hypothetical protein A2699_04760 [Candidatus Gottesmanbacteria bacterium RIFCSPHIGHO2_01_FULL_43_15]OGG25350.1 MAG: hypothetical protein A3A59_05195 [Candidat
MPKKTRQQKILAEKHRLQNSPLVFSYSAIHTKAQINSDIATSQFQYITKDLRKTFTLSALFILAEILLAIFSKRWGW